MNKQVTCVEWRVHNCSILVLRLRTSEVTRKLQPCETGTNERHNMNHHAHNTSRVVNPFVPKAIARNSKRMHRRRLPGSRLPNSKDRQISREKDMQYLRDPGSRLPNSKDRQISREKDCSTFEIDYSKITKTKRNRGRLRTQCTGRKLNACFACSTATYELLLSDVATS